MNSIRYVASQVDARFGHESYGANEASGSESEHEKSGSATGASSGSGSTAPRAHSFLWTVLAVMFFMDGPLVRFLRRVVDAEQPKPPDPPTSTPKQRRKSVSGDTAAMIRRSISRHRQTPSQRSAFTKKTLVLDLDETLIHSMTRGGRGFGPSHMVEVQLPDTGLSMVYYVARRPHCRHFLQQVSQWYDVVVFTASVREYADPMIDWLEADLGRRIFSRRLYRADCIHDNGAYIKDLTVLGQDLSGIMLVDNSPLSYSLQKYNGIGIEGWISDPSDRGLLHLLPLLDAMRQTTDVRSVLCLQDGEAAILRGISTVREE